MTDKTSNCIVCGVMTHEYNSISRPIKNPNYRVAGAEFSDKEYITIHKCNGCVFQQIRRFNVWAGTYKIRGRLADMERARERQYRRK